MGICSWPGRPWALDLPDRVLLIAVYWRTNLTMRQVGPLFWVSRSAAHRGHRHPRPAAGIGPVRRRPVDQITIVDGTLIPTGDRRPAARSKNYRYSTNLQVAIDANTKLVVALGDPQPGNRHDSVAYRDSGINDHLATGTTMGDGAYRGNPDVIISYRKPADGNQLPQWKQDLNATHRNIRAGVEHTFARMKQHNILRDYRRGAATLADIATLYNIIISG